MGAYRTTKTGEVPPTSVAASALSLMTWREGDANVRSVWLCSRNDTFGNVAVIGAAGLVFVTGTVWPDLVVAALMAGVFLSSAIQIVRRSLSEMAAPRAPHAAVGPAEGSSGKRLLPRSDCTAR